MKIDIFIKLFDSRIEDRTKEKFKIRWDDKVLEEDTIVVEEDKVEAKEAKDPETATAAVTAVKTEVTAKNIYSEFMVRERTNKPQHSHPLRSGSLQDPSDIRSRTRHCNFPKRQGENGPRSTSSNAGDFAEN